MQSSETFIVAACSICNPKLIAHKHSHFTHKQLRGCSLLKELGAVEVKAFQQIPTYLVSKMATFRRFRPDDVNKFSKCNLDPFTETYELNFYLQYHAKWPSLFQVCEDMDGNIVGYSKVQS
jgi:hypothetical protein